MQLEKLTISLKTEYSKPGPNNPYQAKLQVGWDDNRMIVALSDETCRRILELAGAEIADAAQVQIKDFVRQALAVSKTTMIEAEAVK